MSDIYVLWTEPVDNRSTGNRELELNHTNECLLDYISKSNTEQEIDSGNLEVDKMLECIIQGINEDRPEVIISTMIQGKRVILSCLLFL